MLQRMRELAVQAQNGTNQTADITNLNKEFSQLATEIDRIADDTKFNGTVLMNAGVTKNFNVGADEADYITVTIGDFNLTEGGVTASGETQGTGTLTMARDDLRTDLASGAFTLGDGTTTISVSLADIQNANNTGTITAANVTQAQIATGINLKANASTNFTATFAADSTTGFTITEKAGFGGSDDVYTIGGSADAATVTLSNGVTGTVAGVLGANLSTYKASASVTVDDAGVIAALDTAIVNIAAARADFGAVINRLEHTVDNLNSSILNTLAAKSQIVDADYAAETTELARTQIISQASTAMLSQANQQAQSVLALLK